MLQVLQIVEAVDDEYRQVSLSNIRKTFANAELGGYVLNQITPVEPVGLFVKGQGALSVSVANAKLTAVG